MKRKMMNRELELIARCYNNIAIRMLIKSGENEIMMKDYLVNGLDIVISKNLINGYEQRRKHHKKRINKKWLKQYGNKPIYDMNYYLMDGKVYMSPKAFDKFKNALGDEEKKKGIILKEI
jgi:hypothetical protein